MGKLYHEGKLVGIQLLCCEASKLDTLKMRLSSEEKIN